MLSIPNQLEGAYLGQDVSLACHTEAYPTSINYWTTERGDMIVSGEFVFPVPESLSLAFTCAGTKRIIFNSLILVIIYTYSNSERQHV